MRRLHLGQETWCEMCDYCLRDWLEWACFKHFVCKMTASLLMVIIVVFSSTMCCGRSLIREQETCSTVAIFVSSSHKIMSVPRLPRPAKDRRPLVAFRMSNLVCVNVLAPALVQPMARATLLPSFRSSQWLLQTWHSLMQRCFSIALRHPAWLWHTGLPRREVLLEFGHSKPTPGNGCPNTYGFSRMCTTYCRRTTVHVDGRHMVPSPW